MSTAWVWILGFGLGGVGAIVRTALGGAIDRRKRTGFPLGTFVVNVSGSFAGGLLLGADLSQHAHLLVATALVGAYTTYSTWITDSERFARTGHGDIALANVFGSLLIGFGAALLGFWITSDLL